MANVDFNELKGQVTDFAVSAAEKAKEIAVLTANQAKRATQAAKLKIEIGTEKENIKKAYVELGKLYYETHKENPEGFFVQLCEEVTASEAIIAKKQALLAELNTSVSESDAPASDPDFEAVVAETEAAVEVPTEDASTEEEITAEESEEEA